MVTLKFFVINLTLPNPYRPQAAYLTLITPTERPFGPNPNLRVAPYRPLRGLTSNLIGPAGLAGN